jgi:hypothetical protein
MSAKKVTKIDSQKKYLFIIAEAIFWTLRYISLIQVKSKKFVLFNTRGGGINFFPWLSTDVCDSIEVFGW